MSQPFLHGLEKNYFKSLKSKDSTIKKNIYISPEIINCLEDCNFSYYDKQRSDIFVLAMVMLEAALLKEIVIYDQVRKKPCL